MVAPGAVDNAEKLGYQLGCLAEAAQWSHRVGSWVPTSRDVSMVSGQCDRQAAIALPPTSEAPNLPWLDLVPRYSPTVWPGQRLMPRLTCGTEKNPNENGRNRRNSFVVSNHFPKGHWEKKSGFQYYGCQPITASMERLLRTICGWSLHGTPRAHRNYCQNCSTRVPTTHSCLTLRANSGCTIFRLPRCCFLFQAGVFQWSPAMSLLS